MCRHLYSIYRNDSAENSIERFHSRGQHLKVFTLEKSSTPTGLVWDTNMADVTSCELYSYFCNNFIVRSKRRFFHAMFKPKHRSCYNSKAEKLTKLINTIFFSEKCRISFLLFVYIVVFLLSLKLQFELRVNANNTKLD